MQANTEQLWQAVRLGEDSGLELTEVQLRGKRVSAPARDNLADELAAFANARGGRLVLGVKDDRTPQSLEPASLDALMDMVSAICEDSIRPRLDYEAHRVAVPGGNGGVLVVNVSPGDTVHRSPGGYYRRFGDTKRQMQAEEIRRLLQARGQSAAATDSQTVANTGVNTLRPELWRRYASSRTNESAEVTLGKLKFAKADRSGALRAACCSLAKNLASGCRTPTFKRSATTANAWTATASSTPKTSAAPWTARSATPCASWRATVA